MTVPNVGTFRQKAGWMQQDNNFAERFIMAGGLNIEQPVANGDAGKLIFCQNFEPNYAGGYKSKAGYEPIDGHRQPSAVFYQALKLGSFTGPATNKPATIGQTVTGVSTGATGQFLGWETIGGVQYIILSRVNSSFIRADWKLPTDPVNNDVTQFQNGETLKTGIASNFAILDAAALTSPSIDDVTRAAYYIGLARDLARAQIGSIGAGFTAGRALGAFDLNGIAYGIRNNSGNTASTLWKTTSTGWQSVPLGITVYFTAMSRVVNEGDVIQNVGATRNFVVRRVVIQFGSVGSADARGYFVTTAVVGGPFLAGDILQVAGTNTAVAPASGPVQVNNTLPPDLAATPTNYRFRRYNFSGAPNSTRIYGVSGRGPAFEFDGTNFVPIITGEGLKVSTFNTISALEQPTCLAVQSDQLFLGYRGGAIQHSGYQQPDIWTAVAGADTRQAGDDITNLVEDINGTMLIQTKTRNGMLYGDVNENFQLRWVNSSFGAYPDTAQRMNGAMFLTDEGVMFQGQSVEFGNFASVTQSSDVNGLLRKLMRDGAGVVEATLSRDGSLYRLFFDSGKMLSFCVVGDQCVGIGYCDYGMRVTNFWSGPSTVATGNSSPPPERILFCGADGNVYQDDSGGSFGGSFIVGKMQTQFYRGQDNIALMKKYRQMFVDLLGADAYTNLQFGAEFDDGANYRTPEVFENVTRFLTGGDYESFSAYNQAFYGPSGKNVVRKQLHGQGVGISFIIMYSSNISLSFNVQAIEFVAALRSRRGWR